MKSKTNEISEVFVSFFLFLNCVHFVVAIYGARRRDSIILS